MARAFIIGRKGATNKIVEGVAKTGEISPQGTVSHIEDWDGRIEAIAAPPTTHYVYFKSTGELRRKTLQELIDEGKFYVGHGPTGVSLRS